MNGKTKCDIFLQWSIIVIKRNGISIYALTWMDLEKIICEGKSDTGQILYESLCMKYLEVPRAWGKGRMGFIS